MKTILSILLASTVISVAAQNEAVPEENVPGVFAHEEACDTITPAVLQSSIKTDGAPVTAIVSLRPTSGDFQFSVIDASTPDSLWVPVRRFTPGVVQIVRWRSGRLFGMGNQRLMPGLMQVDYGSLGLSQTAGDFEFYIGASAHKYGYFQGVHTQYGVNGSVSYRINPNTSLTVFGNYYFGGAPYLSNGMPLSPAMLGYYETNKFGGYIDHRVSDRFGVLVGGQTVQQTGTNRYRNEPIVTPYVKVGKIGVGLPVGQILNGLLGR